MRYIILESRFENVIKKYLDSQIGPFDVIDFVDMNRNKQKYLVIDGKVIGEIEYKVLWLDEEIYYNLYKIEPIFSLSPETANDMILRYFSKYHNIDVEGTRHVVFVNSGNIR